MYTGSLPSVPIYSTWLENIEVWSIDDDSQMDLSDVVEITLQLIDRESRDAELTLTMSDGDITVPDTGVIQWRAEQETMGALEPKLYNVVLTMEDDTDVVTLVLGTISVLD